MLWSMGSQRVGHDLATGQQQAQERKRPCPPSYVLRAWAEPSLPNNGLNWWSDYEPLEESNPADLEQHKEATAPTVWDEGQYTGSGSWGGGFEPGSEMGHQVQNSQCMWKEQPLWAGDLGLLQFWGLSDNWARVGSEGGGSTEVALQA